MWSVAIFPTGGNMIKLKNLILQRNELLNTEFLLNP